MCNLFNDEPACISCRYVRKTPIFICEHPESFEGRDPIEGYSQYRSCRHMRQRDTQLVRLCGPEGKLFEPRPPRKGLLKFILGE